MAKKSKTPSYVLTLPLKLEPFQMDVIDKRLEISRKIYNAVLGLSLKRYNALLESKEYRKNETKLKNINKEYYAAKLKKDKKEIDKVRKKLYKDRDDIYFKYGLTNYSLYEDVKPMYKHFKDNIGSLQSQAIADRVYKAVKEILDGNNVYFKKYGQVNSKWF